MSEDAGWLDAAVALAEPHLGTTAENPTVGAIVVDATGQRVGQGVTAPGGRPHAETIALADAGESARDATLYVTLEPCNHFGRTPPCSEAVVAAGIARVVVGILDPDPRTAGGGVETLRAAGVAVEICNHPGSARLHEGFVCRVTNGRPFVTAKLAVSADGMIGREGVPNFPITGEIARAWTHALRARSDAVMVGAGTARLDNPRLTVRLEGYDGRQPRRVVLAGDGALDPSLALLADAGAAQVLDGRDPAAALRTLAGQGVSTVLVEGGATVTDALLAAGLVDRFHLLESAVVVGAGGVPATPHGSLAARLAAATLVEVDQRRLGADNLRTFERA